ncbi:MAG: DUF4389 domain-containing protein [Actinomycetota bacterium]|nr:DUF4389 domain-containing protein [Actinomycetota bacterium]
MQEAAPYPVRFEVDYPERELNRLTTGFRLILAIPILLLIGSVDGSLWEWGAEGGRSAVVAAGGVLFFGPLATILFRRKYPAWWFEWNRELSRFSNRVGVYMGLMDDRYPATDDEQSVHLEIDYPDAATELNRWLPLVKWFLAIPHYVVLFFLTVGAVFAVVGAWFSILFTGRYPRALFRYVEGVMRWHNRVMGYAFLLVTDRYPPFRLAS